MAGDWIKMRADLFTHPKVVRIMSALKADALRTVGGLMSVWCLFDAHSEDGKLIGYTHETLDSHLRWDGFAEQMAAVGWLENDTEGLVLPRFDTHNGQSAKRRAQDSDRKKSVRKTSASEADKMRTREEKRREENKAGATKATRLPANWILPKDWGNWALDERLDWTRDDVVKVAADFHDYWIAKSGKDACKLDWLATWRKWVRNSRKPI